MSKHTIHVMCALVALLSLSLPCPAATAPPAVWGPQHYVYLPILRTPTFITVLFAYPSFPKSGYNGWLIGTVQNMSDRPVYDVSLEAHFYDAAGTQVLISTGPLVLPATFAGEMNSFNLRAPDTWEESYTYEVRVTHLSLSSPVEYRPLTVVSQASSVWEVTGEIRNDQRVPVSAIQVLVALVDSHLSSLAQINATTLAPGETTSYRAQFYLLWQTAFVVQAQGVVTP